MNNEIKRKIDFIKQILNQNELIRCSRYFNDLLDYITNLQQEIEKTRLENKVLKEQMIAMVQPTYTYGIGGGSNE